jgi:hypothetical protein
MPSEKELPVIAAAAAPEAAVASGGTEPMLQDSTWHGATADLQHAMHRIETLQRRLREAEQREGSYQVRRLFCVPLFGPFLSLRESEQTQEDLGS